MASDANHDIEEVAALLFDVGDFHAVKDRLYTMYHYGASGYISQRENDATQDGDPAGTIPGRNDVVYNPRLSEL